MTFVPLSPPDLLSPQRASSCNPTSWDPNEGISNPADDGDDGGEEQISMALTMDEDEAMPVDETAKGTHTGVRQVAADNVGLDVVIVMTAGTGAAAATIIT